MSKKREYPGNIVFSTDPDYSKTNDNNQSLEKIESRQQCLRVYTDKKNRSGKVVTIISGHRGSEDSIKSLGKLIRNQCGTGGSVKNGLIIIQGNLVLKVIEILTAQGHQIAKIGKPYSLFSDESDKS